MKRIMKRGVAISVYNHMAKLPFGHLPDGIIEAVMDNFINLGKEAEQFQRLTQELNRRLFEGVDKKRIDEYNSAIKTASVDEIKELYPDIYALVLKQKNIVDSLRSKDVEVELEAVDRKEFIKGIIKGKPDVAMGTLDMLASLFTNESKEADFGELDSLISKVDAI